MLAPNVRFADKQDTIGNQHALDRVFLSTQASLRYNQIRGLRCGSSVQSGMNRHGAHSLTPRLKQTFYC